MKKFIWLTVAFLASSTLLVAALLQPSLAFFTDRQQAVFTANAGTLQVSVSELAFLPVGSSVSEPVVSGNKITAWAPGDINTIQWSVDNLGNKSVDLRYTIRLYWDKGLGLATSSNEPAESALWAESPYIYLYPATMSDADITKDLNSSSPSKFIDMGSSDAEYVNGSGAVRYGYLYTFADVTLDGTGDNAETGDATVSGAKSDTQKFKIALAPNAPAGFMNRNLVFELLVDGKQHRNTTDSDWSLIGTQATN